MRKTVQEMAEQLNYKLPNLKQDVLLAQYAADTARENVKRLMHVRRPTLQTEAPIPGGRETLNQPAPTREHSTDTSHVAEPDPRFANAPITLDE